MSALGNTILLIAVRQTEGDADRVLTTHGQKTTVLLGNKLAAIVGPDLRRAPDLLNENLERLPGTILRAEEASKMTDRCSRQSKEDCSCSRRWTPHQKDLEDPHAPDREGSWRAGDALDEGDGISCRLDKHGRRKKTNAADHRERARE